MQDIKVRGVGGETLLITIECQRQLPTDLDYAVPTREYQLDQSSPLPASAAADPVLDRSKTTSAP
jgi:hypothetical protein